MSTQHLMEMNLSLSLDFINDDFEGLKMKFTMIIVAILVPRFLVKLRFPANTSISVALKFIRNAAPLTKPLPQQGVWQQSL